MMQILAAGQSKQTCPRDAQAQADAGRECCYRASTHKTAVRLLRPLV